MRIITDSAADFTREELQQYEVDCVNTGVMLNGEPCVVGENLTEDEFWQHLLAGESVKTSQPAPELFMKEFKKAKANGEEVVCINVSSAVSGTMQSAQIAVSMTEYDKIHVVDSLNGMAGQKLLAIYACRLRDEGKLLAAEIAEKLEAFRGRIRLFACLDTLDNLARSGRIPHVLASLGAVAQIKPLLTVDEAGRIVMCGKAFGRHRAIDGLAKCIAARKIDHNFPVIPLFSYDRSNCDALIRKLQSMGVAVDQKFTSAIGPSVAGHIGPYAYGLAFVEAE